MPQIYSPNDPAVLAAIETIDRESQSGADPRDVVDKLRRIDRKFPNNPWVLTWKGRAIVGLIISATSPTNPPAELVEDAVDSLERAVELLIEQSNRWPSEILGNAYCGLGQMLAAKATITPDNPRFAFDSVGCLLAAFLMQPRDQEFSNELRWSLATLRAQSRELFRQLLALLAEGLMSVGMHPALVLVQKRIAPVLALGGSDVDARRRILNSFLILYSQATPPQLNDHPELALEDIFAASVHVGGPDRLMQPVRSSGGGPDRETWQQEKRELDQLKQELEQSEKDLRENPIINFLWWCMDHKFLILCVLAIVMGLLFMRFPEIDPFREQKRMMRDFLSN